MKILLAALNHYPEKTRVSKYQGEMTTWLAAPSILLAARLSGAHAYLHVQDFEVDAALGLGLLKQSFWLQFAAAFERVLLRAFPTVITISQKMHEKLIEKTGGANRSFLIPNWAGVDDFDPTQGLGQWPARLKNLQTQSSRFIPAISVTSKASK